MREPPMSPENGNAVSHDTNGVESARELPPRFTVPERGTPPKVERLNRNALTIAAVVMGILVIAAVVLVPTPRADNPSGVRPVTPPAQEPTFLDQPSHPGMETRGPSTEDDAAAQRAARAALDSAAMAYQLSGPGGSSVAGRTGNAGGSIPSSGAVDAPQGDVMQSARVPTVGTEELRAAAYHAAVMASPTIRAGEGDAQVTPAVTIEQSASQPSGARVTAGPASSATLDAPAGRERFRQFLGDVRRPTPSVVRAMLEPAPGPYTLQAGTMIPAVLVTEVNSDLPGDVLAQVSRDVYDSRSQRTLLLPKGAKLLGRYHDQIGVGQDRLLLAWTRVILPDGRSMTLPGLPTTDQAGAGGIADQVDRHASRMFGTAALLSLIGAGVQLSQPQGGYGPWGAPSAGQVAAGAVGQQLAGVATQLLQRDLDVQPTIRIRQGMPFNVFLNADLTFPGPYLLKR
jgi:type IV secretory pathway VirB10-like protein